MLLGVRTCLKLVHSLCYAQYFFAFAPQLRDLEHSHKHNFRPDPRLWKPTVSNTRRLAAFLRGTKGFDSKSNKDANL